MQTQHVLLYRDQPYPNKSILSRTLFASHKAYNESS